MRKRDRWTVCLRIGIVWAAVGMIGVSAGTTEAEAVKKVLPKRIKASGNMLDESKISLQPGEKVTIDYTVKPAKAKNKKVTFSSSNKKVAKVTAKGVVSGVQPGTATITVRSKAKKSVKTTLKVTVKKPVSSQVTTYQSAAAFPPLGDSTAITDAIDTYLAATSATGIMLDRTYIELAAGESDKLTATVVPVTSTDKVVWSIDYLGGINVYQTGSIFVTEDTPVGTTATITATCGRVTASCKVVVVNGPCEHVWGVWSITQAPTCTVEGIQTSECEKCGKTREEPVAATGHSFLGRTLTEPTCTEVGETEYTCQNCGEVKTEIVNAKGHTWGTAGEILEAPTCTKRGKKKYTCTVPDCDGEKIETLESLGHTWDDGEITKSPTCTGAGTRTYHCLIEGCSGTKKEQIDATGHTWTYGEITLEPGCTSLGKRMSTCLNCSARMTVTLEATGHEWDSGKVTKEPTCTLQGTTTFTCVKCQGTKTQGITPLGHEVGDYVVDVEATCTDAGRESKHCTRAGCTYRQDIRKIPALNHVFNEDDPNAGEITIAPDCINAGIKTYTCTRDGCDVQKRKLLPALKHDWTPDYVIDVEPTCTVNGKKSIHCQRPGCGKTKNTSSVPMLGHEWDVAGVVKVEPTCTKDGSNTYTCIREVKDEDGNVTGTCGAHSVEIVRALGHDFAEDWTLDRKPDCVQPGQKSKHCKNSYTNSNGILVKCSEKEDATLVEPIGHTWNFADDVPWAEVTAPSHGVAGTEMRTCSSCGATQTRNKVEEHVYDSSGTCTTCGESVSLVKAEYTDWEYVLNEDAGTVLLKKYIGTKTNLLIPKTMNVKKADGTIVSCQVVFNGNYEPRTQTGVFASNKKCEIKAVSFEEGVQITNMNYMFYGCEKLETVLNIPTTVTEMLGTFKGCIALEYVGKLPDNITELNSTFEDCSSLVAAPAVPVQVTSLYCAFRGCEKLAAAPVLPDGLINLGFTFSGCKNLCEPPALPMTVTEMTDTFRSCTSLLRVPEDIPAGVTDLVTTFYDCDALQIVPKMPSTVTTMKFTFKNCDNITYAVPLPGTVIYKEDVFAGCDKMVQIED